MRCARALLLPLLPCLALLDCATTPPAPAVAPPAASTVAAAPEETSTGSVAPAERLSSAPPPARRRRQFVVTEAEYLKLRKAFPRGFQPDDCTAYCKQESARTPSEDGEWIWTLRCLLDRNMRDEPIVSCREEARAARDRTDETPAKASTYTVIDE